MKNDNIFTVFLIAMILVSCAPAGKVIPTETVIPASPPSPYVTTVPVTSVELPTATSTPRPRIKAGDDLGFLKGMNYVSWDSTNYGHPLSDLSLKALADTGTEWVTINVSGQQTDRSSTEIRERVHQDAAVIHAIQTVHELDMNVMIKVSVVFSNDFDAWGGSIGETFNASQWDEWFASYTELILYYSKMAEENGVEMICIGTELGKAQMQAEQFTKLVTEVRKVFSGPVTYGADWSSPETKWWDQVDYIGIDAYYHVSKESSPSLEELEAGWQTYVAELEALSQKWNKPIILTEVGFNAQEYSACNGGCGRNMEAAELGKLDPQTQANVYQSLFNVFRDKEWFQGTFWWMWDDSPFSGGMCDPQYTPKGKLAENVLRTEYGAAPATLTYPAPLPVFDEDQIVTFPIFADEFENAKPDKWGNLEMSTVVSPAYMGTQALKFDFNDSGGFSAFLPPLDTNPYQWLEFYIYPETDVDSGSFTVFVGDQDWQEHYFNDLTHCNYLDNQSSIVSGRWNRILIPLEEIAADNRVLNSLSFSNYSSTLTVFWVDEIRFVGLK